MTNVQGTNKVMEILLIEDSGDDIDLTIEALKSTNMKHNLNVFTNGIEALAFLKKENQHSNAPKPDIILLDLKLPGKDGHEILTEIKKEPKLKRIPVIVLTTSQNEQDINRAYDAYANCYIVKPLNLKELLQVMQFIEDWLTVAKIPAN